VRGAERQAHDRHQTLTLPSNGETSKGQDCMDMFLQHDGHMPFPASTCHRCSGETGFQHAGQVPTPDNDAQQLEAQRCANRTVYKPNFTVDCSSAQSHFERHCIEQHPNDVCSTTFLSRLKEEATPKQSCHQRSKKADVMMEPSETLLLS
jgi:hypothetical protein